MVVREAWTMYPHGKALVHHFVVEENLYHDTQIKIYFRFHYKSTKAVLVLRGGDAGRGVL